MKRVLLVGGHKWFRQGLAIVLKQHTDLKENVRAGSLGEARRILAELNAKVDLAIFVLDLHAGNATELIEHLRKVGIAVMVLDADPSLERGDRALQAGAGEVLTMATSVEQLIDTTKRLVCG